MPASDDAACREGPSAFTRDFQFSRSYFCYILVLCPYFRTSFVIIHGHHVRALSLRKILLSEQNLLQLGYVTIDATSLFFLI